MKMNASARQVHCELPPERISGVSQNKNEAHPKMEMHTEYMQTWGLKSEMK
jgi:hypothetical protein